MSSLETERQAMNLETLPIISLKAFCDPQDTPESLEARKACAGEIRNACMQAGFFYLVDHGVSQELCDATFARSRSLFGDLTDEEKETMNATENRLFRGFISEKCGAHTCSTPTAPQGHKDRKESYTIGAEVDASEIDQQTGQPYSSPMHGPNSWPDEEKLQAVQGYQEGMKTYWNECTFLARRIARGLAMSLNLDETFFDGCLKHPAANMVLLRYSPVPPAETVGEGGEAVVTGCGEHTDCGFLTILAQDDVGGLQVKHADGRWIDAPYLPGSFVINLGDMAQRWSNDLYKSTWHRVQNPTGRERFSIPFFCNCDFETVVEGITNPDDSCKYEKITAGEYILKRLDLMRLVEGDGEEAGQWRKMLGAEKTEGTPEVMASMGATPSGSAPSQKELVKKRVFLKGTETKTGDGATDPKVKEMFEKAWDENAGDKAKICAALGIDDKDFTDGLDKAEFLRKFCG